MKSRKPIITLVAFILLVVLVVFGWQQQQEFKPEVINQSLVPELSTKLNDIKLIELTIGEKTLTMERKDDKWLLSQQADYQIDTSKIRSLLFKLSESKLLEAKTADKARYAKLGLDKASRVVVSAWLDDEKKQVLFALALGDNRGTTGTYVLRDVLNDNSSQSWLTSGILLFDSQLASWVDTELFNISPNDLKEVTIRQSSGQTILLNNLNGEASMKFVDLHATEEANQTQINAIATALRNLQFKQVAYHLDRELPAAVLSTFTSTKGLVINILVYAVTTGENEEYWSTFELSVDKESIITDPDNTADTIDNIVAESQQEIDQLAAKIKGRIFLLPSSVGKALISQRSDLILEKSKEDEK